MLSTTLLDILNLTFDDFIFFKLAHNIVFLWIIILSKYFCFFLKLFLFLSNFLCKVRLLRFNFESYVFRVFSLLREVLIRGIIWNSFGIMSVTNLCLLFEIIVVFKINFYWTLLLTFRLLHLLRWNYIRKIEFFISTWEH